jgi:TMEM175 potassium channel family protein
MPMPPHPPYYNGHNTELGLERIVFFSDAVMAIAITLLVIDLKVPEIPAALAATQLPIQLEELMPRLGSFFISFVVIGVYWNAHHRYFSYIRRYDNLLILLNMVFLLFIVLMPFVASLLGLYVTLPLGVIVYSLAVSLTGLSLAAIWFYATYRHRLVDEQLDVQMIRFRLQIALFGPLVFLISIPFAWINPSTTMTVWWISPLVLFGIRRLMRSRPARQASPGAEAGSPMTEVKAKNQGQ